METALAARLARVDLLQQGLRDGRPHPDRMTAWYCASALTGLEGAPADVCSQVRSRHIALIDQLGRHRAPTGEMRWAYAAILAARGIEVESFLAHREALRAARLASSRNEKTGALHGGGARAALVLAACAVEPGPGADAFFEMKVALNPPWWRRNAAVTDLYCAAHAARQDSPRSVAQARARAEEVFQSDRRARGHKRTGAKACALFEAEPRAVLRRFQGLDEARRSLKALRRRVDREMIMEWAAQGLEPGDLSPMAELVEALPKHLGSISTGRSRLAHLIHTHGQTGLPLGEISALAAIIAAQTAAITAVMVASTTASTTASTAT